MPQTTGFAAPVLITFILPPSFTKSDFGEENDRFGCLTSRTARSVRDFYGLTKDTQSARSFLLGVFRFPPSRFPLCLSKITIRKFTYNDLAIFNLPLLSKDVGWAKYRFKYEVQEIVDESIFKIPSCFCSAVVSAYYTLYYITVFQKA